MNKVLGMVVMVTAVSASIVFAEPKHGMQGMMPEGHGMKAMAPEGVRDSVQPQHEMGMRDLDKEPGRMEPWEQRLALHERKCNEQMEQCRNMAGHMTGHHFMFPVLCFMIFLTLMVMINVLLTIIVSLDMARGKKFNGLWIPILLVAGIPGTALYALFRLGDNVKAKE